MVGSTTIVVAQPAQPPGNPSPTFKAQVEYVEVDALVTDQQGAFVPNLTIDDFQVFEDGKRQKISSFALINIPVERDAAPRVGASPIEPDVQSNERPFDGRVYVMLLDDLHVASLRSQPVKDAARRFITQSLGANDLMAIVFTGGRSQDAQEFTSNKRLLLNAVDRFVGQKLPSLTAAREDDLRNQRNLPTFTPTLEPDDQLRAGYARSMLSTLQFVAGRLGGVHGRRKTVMWFSEGIDYDLTEVMRGGNVRESESVGILQNVRDAVAAAARANVSIYSIDPRGLSTLGDEAIGLQQPSERSLSRELRLQQDNLRQLADDTGGLAFVNRNDYSALLERIVADNSAYYVLAYDPPSKKRDGTFHRIEVKTTRPGLTVRSRRGYSTARGNVTSPRKPSGMRQELFEALTSPLPSAGLAMRVFTAPFKGPSPQASVLIGIEMLGRDLTLEGGRVDISYRAIDALAKVQAASNDTLSLDLPPDVKSRVAATGLRVLNRIDIPAGRYQLRIAAHDPGSRKLGSVIYDLEVPDFHASSLSISGLALSSLASSALLTARADDQMRSVLPAAPVSQRMFARNDELTLFAEVYDAVRDNAPRIDVVTTVAVANGNGVVFQRNETLDPNQFKDSPGVYGFTTPVPLSQIPPGHYILRVEARSRAGNGPGAVREIPFAIAPPAP